MPLIMEPEAKKFPILSLPQKLRNRIYEYVLLSHKPVEIHEATRRRRSSVSRGAPVEVPGRISALLRSCKQIRREAAPLFYGRNTFIIPWGFPNLGCRWLESLASSHRRALRDVRFCYGDGAFWTVYDAKVALNALRMSLDSTKVLNELQETRLWVPVCEFSVHTWTELYKRDDAHWVSSEGDVKRFSDGKDIEWKL